MTETTWNPWAAEYNELFTRWIKAGLLAGVIDREIDLRELVQVIDCAEELDILENVSREQAILLAGLWMGRYHGNQETGQWTAKELREGELEQLKECCQDFLDVADEVTGQAFWTNLARLRVAVENIHPENVM